jgi:hypothetical protein
MGQMRNAHKILVGKPEVKRPLQKPWHSWRKTLKTDLEEIQLEGVDCGFL